MSEPYSLISVEKRAEVFPGSFHIPTRKTRDTLRAGQFAKVIFEQHQPGPEPFTGGIVGERMWVKITKVAKAPANVDGSRTWYRGRLDNEPQIIVGLEAGAEVSFTSEHVLDWMES